MDKLCQLDSKGGYLNHQLREILSNPAVRNQTNRILNRLCKQQNPWLLCWELFKK